MNFLRLPFETSPWVTGMLPKDKGRAVKITRKRVSGVRQNLLPFC